MTGLFLLINAFNNHLFGKNARTFTSGKVPGNASDTIYTHRHPQQWSAHVPVSSRAFTDFLARKREKILRTGIIVNLRRKK
jgi:hypothetical protein